jgi:hypothetical protein
MTSQRRDTRIDQFFDQLLAHLRESPTPAPASPTFAHPQPGTLPDISPNSGLMMAMRQRRRMHHSAWRSRA